MKKFNSPYEQLAALGYTEHCKCTYQRNLHGHIVRVVELKCREHNGMKKLTKMLQRAHAGETAAYLAYEGHAKSVRDSKIKAEIFRIQKDEAAHRAMAWFMLRELGAEPSAWQDTVFTAIGKAFGLLSRLTGYVAPMHGALLIEKIWVGNYKEMAEEARSKRLFEMHAALVGMKETEEEHEEFFRTCLERKAGSDR